MRGKSRFQKFSWNGFRCNIIPARYWNSRLCLLLDDARSGDPIAVITTNLPEFECSAEEIFVKDYGETEGIVEALRKAGIIEAPSEWFSIGFLKAARCKLSDPAFWEKEGRDDRT